MIVRELLAKLGIELDKGSFTAADVVLAGVKTGMIALGGLAIAASVGLGTLVHDLVETTSSLNDTSQAIGVNTESLQELAYAAKLNGAGFDEVAISLGKLNKYIYAAKDGNDEAIKTFSKLNIHIRDTSGQLKSADVVFGEVADRFAKMPDGPKKSALAMDLFGRSGARLIPTLNAGKAGLADLANEAHELGFVIDSATIAAGDDLGDNLDRLTMGAKGLGYAIAGPLLPQVNELVLSLLAWLKANRTLLAQRIDKIVKVLTVLGKAFVYVLDAMYESIGFVIDNWKFFAIILSSVVLTAIALNITEIGILIAQYFALGVAAVATALRAAAAWVAAAAGPIAIAALIAIAILLADDLNVYLEGGKSLIGELLPSWSKFMEDFLNGGSDDDPWWLKSIRGFIYLITHLGVFWQVAIDEMKALLNAFAEWVTGWSRRIGNAITAPINAVGDFLKNNVIGHLTTVTPSTSGTPAPSIPVARGGAPAMVNTQTTNDIKIYQQPGESSSDVAGKVRAEIDAARQTELEQTAAALGIG